MIPKNAPAADVEMLGSYTASAWNANALYTAIGIGGTFIETWGNAYSQNVMGILGQFKRNGNVDLYTPWGQVVLTALGNITSAHVRVYFTGVTLIVTSGCNWTLAWSSIDLYLAYNGVGEYNALHVAAGSISGAGYDERLNDTLLQIDGSLSPSPPYTSSCAPRAIDTASTAADSQSMSGGYRPYVSGVPTPDSIVLDGSSAGGTCPCSIGLPGISGTNSYNVGISNSVSSSLTVTPVTVSCAGCTPPSVAAFTTVFTTTQTIARTVSIKGSMVGVVGQNTTGIWTCDNNGVMTSGSSNVPSTSPPTTCASTRSSYYNVETTNDIFIIPFRIPVCPPPFGCTPPCAIIRCQWGGQAVVSWPSLPPCTSVSLFIDNTHDDNAIVYRSQTDDITIKMTRYNFADVMDTFTVFTAGGAIAHAKHISIACGSINDLWIVFDDNTTTWITRSTNAGNNWSTPVSIATGTWPKGAVDLASATEFCVIYDGTKYNCWRKTTSDAVFKNVGTIVTAPAGGGGLTIRPSVNPIAIFEITDVSGNVVRYISSNMGVNWTLS